MPLLEPEKLLPGYPSSRRYSIGVSGGRDSIALLHALVEFGYRKLVVCHLDHQLRGRASKADARFVEKLAAKYRVDFEFGSEDVRAIAAKKKLSIETAARSARYEFFARIARRRRCRTIFLAHHADDLVETFLINLFRGAGSSGLAAMREVVTREILGRELEIVRPLLAVWRREIDDYVKANRLTFREDTSNRSLLPLRNRIRRRVIPYLEKQFDREIRKSVWRAAMIASEEENFFAALSPKQRTDLAVNELRAMPLALQRRALRQWLRGHDVAEISFDLVERVRALLDLTSGVAKTNLPGNRYARRRAGRIFLE